MNFKVILVLPKRPALPRHIKVWVLFELFGVLGTYNFASFITFFFEIIFHTFIKQNWIDQLRLKKYLKQIHRRSIFFRFGFNPLSNNIVTSNCDKGYKMFSTEVESFRSKNDFPNKVRCGEFQIFRNILIWRHFFR